MGLFDFIKKQQAGDTEEQPQQENQVQEHPDESQELSEIEAPAAQNADREGAEGPGDCLQTMEIEQENPSKKNADPAESPGMQEEQSEPAQEKPSGLFSKLAAGLTKTRENIWGGVDQVLSAFKKIDEELYEELEEALIMADMGVETAMQIIESLRENVKSKRLTEAESVKAELKSIIGEMLKQEQGAELERTPLVLLVIGVNGVGKTTTIGKLSSRYKGMGKNVMIAAADTFRAAAIDQLEVWAQRSGCPLIKQQEGADPGAVVFDACNAAKARGADVLICDTAGRLHNKKNLMDELGKIHKIIQSQFPEAAQEIYIVIDATTGQNAMQQVKTFKEICDITGIVLTKLDGTAKGGIVVAIRNELKVPVRYVGVGEAIEDLQPFDASAFTEALFREG